MEAAHLMLKCSVLNRSGDRVEDNWSDEDYSNNIINNPSELHMFMIVMEDNNLTVVFLVEE